MQHLLGSECSSVSNPYLNRMDDVLDGTVRRLRPPLLRKVAQRIELIGLFRRLVVTPAQDAWEAYGDPGLVARGTVDRFEAEFEHVPGRQRTHRTEALERVGADPAVQAQDLRVVQPG